MGDTPPGFSVLRAGGPFIKANGPIYIRHNNAGAVLGFRIRESHCNPVGICHGGWLASMADMVLPVSGGAAGSLDGIFLMTISMSLDFFGQAALGAWVEGHGEMLRRTRRMAFMRAILSVDDAPILRASGIYRLVPKPVAGGAAPS